MGSENLFHKRKAKNANELQRRSAYRQANKRILIVCEGETEVLYFKEAREYYKLNAIDVEINNDGNSAPKNIVRFAKKSFIEARSQGNPFDQVFCVFDKDAHQCFNDALQAISSAKPINTFFAIVSVPCFEYWILLHFEYTTQPINNAQDAEGMLRKKYLKNYRKNQKGLFNMLLNNLETAEQYASQLFKECSESNTDNPSTRVHKLIKELKTINRQ